MVDDLQILDWIEVRMIHDAELNQERLERVWDAMERDYWNTKEEKEKCLT